MSVFQRKSTRGKTKTWNYKFVAAGKAYRGSTGLTDRNEAVLFEARLKAQAARGRTIERLVTAARADLGPGASIPLARAWAAFMAKPRESIGSKRLAGDESRWTDFVCYLRDNFPEVQELAQVTRQQAESYIAHIRTQGRWVREMTRQGKRRVVVTQNPCRQLSPASCNDFLKISRRIFATLQDDAGLIDNPFDKIKALKVVEVNREPFTPDELRKIGAASEGTWIYPLFLIGVMTGLREGDICLLKWSEVDLQIDLLTRRTRKTGKVVKVPILPELRRYLLSLDRDGEYVLPELAETYRTRPSSIGAGVTTFLAKLGIQSNVKVPGRDRAVSVKDVHSLRHTFCCLAGVHGVRAAIIQSIVGHSCFAQTAHYMDHETDATRRDMLARIPSYLTGETAAEPQEGDPRAILAAIRGKLQAMDSSNWEQVRDAVMQQIA